MRFILLLLPLALAACSNPGAGLSPEAAIEAAEAAIDRGEAREAIALYKHAAERGDLDASETLATAMERGYLSPGRTSRAANLAFLPYPGEASRWIGRYEREQAAYDADRDQRARAGDPEALLQVATALSRWQNRDASAADRDSSRAIRQRLIAANHAPAMFLEALMTIQDDSLRAHTLLKRATDLGHGQSCLFRLATVHAHEGYEHVMSQTRAGLRPTRVPMAMEVRHIDEVEACPPLPAPHKSEGAQYTIRNIMARDTPEARARIDSLRILGVFDRYPHLDPNTLS